jgi:hypothetical protein
MRRRDLTNALLGSAAAATALTHCAEAGVSKSSSRGRIPAEIAAGATPVDFTYPADPYVDPRRYGADPTGATDSTSALQTAVDVAYRCKGVVWIGNGCNYLCRGVTLRLTGDHATDGIRILGSSVNGSRLTQHQSSSAILTFMGSTPTGNPQESPIVLENFSIACTGNTCDGIVLNGVGGWTIRRVCIVGARRTIWLNSALIGLIEDCYLFSGTHGILGQADGSGAGPSFVTIRNCCINAHSRWGIDFGAADRLKIEACDLEENGTAAHPDTGAVALRSSIGFATGYATVDLDGVWLESNRGQTLLVESNTRLTLAIRNTNWYSDEKGHSLLINRAAFVSIEDSIAPAAAAAIWDITASFLFLKNVIVHTLIDDGVNFPTYTNVQSSTGYQINGRKDSFAATLTGVSGAAPTARITVHQQGDEIVLDFPSALTGTSNSTGCSITGLPSRYWPQDDTFGLVVAQDSGRNQAMPCVVSHSSGEITLDHRFALSGSKGIVGGTIRMRRGLG